MKSRTAAEVSQLIKPSSQRFPPSVSSGNLNSIFQCVARGLCIDMWYSGKTEWGESIKILTQYWETSPKSSGAAFSPPFLSLPLPSLSVLPPSFTLSSVSSISRPLLYLPLASHCRALREAQTALDKVRMIHVLWFFWIWAMVKKNKKKHLEQCFSLSLHAIFGLTLESAPEQICEWRREWVCIKQAKQSGTASCVWLIYWT